MLRRISAPPGSERETLEPATREAPLELGIQGSFFFDLMSTSAVQILTAILNVTSLAAISRRMGQTELGYYTLERRAMALLLPMAVLGLYVATTRYVALAIGRQSGNELRYARTGAAIVLVAATSVAIILVAAPTFFASLLFGDEARVGLVRALAGFVLVMAMYGIAYSIYRGRLAMAAANLLELLVVGIFPLVLVFLGFRSFLAYMWALNGAIAAATAVWLVVGIGRHAAPGPARATRSETGSELLRYGLPRVPGEIALIALFSLPPIVVVHYADAVAAGYTSVVLSSLNLVALVTAPMSVLLLPRIAREIGRGELRDPRYSFLAQATLDFGIGCAALLIVASPVLIRFWFPSAPAEVVSAEQVLAIGIPGYLIYMIFRSYLDALDRRPLSSIPTVAGLVALAAVLPPALAVHGLAPPVAAALAVSVAGLVAGAVTLLLLRGRLAGMSPPRDFVLPLAAGLGIALVGVWARSASVPNAIALVAAATGAYAIVVVRLRREWVVEAVDQFSSWKGGR